MLNVAQFSSAKSMAKSKLMQAEVFNEEEHIKGYSKFSKDVEQITDIVDSTWLRTEYDTNVRNVIQGEQFRGFMDDADLYPYWVYLGVMDDREREAHVELEGLVFRIGDPEGDAVFPVNEDNCRCSGDNVDDQYLAENKKSVLTNEEAGHYLENNVDERFRFNPAVQGSMPNTGSYFEVLPNANKAGYKDFGLPTANELGGDKELTGLSAKGLHHLLNIMHEWQQEYHTDGKGNIIFQNKQTMANVKFTNNSLHTIQKHGRGFENIPDTIANPDELWMTWTNAAEQRSVNRVYIKFGAISYLVKTTDGVVTDAHAVSNTAANGFRKGALA